jgi:hypothetical protein
MHMLAPLPRSDCAFSPPRAHSGTLCNFAFALMVPYIPGWILMLIGASGTAVRSLRYLWLFEAGRLTQPLSRFIQFSCVLFANIVPSVTYWAFGFPSIFFVVFGADFVYATSTIYIA